MEVVFKKWWWLVLTAVAAIIILLAIIRTQKRLQELDQYLEKSTTSLKKSK